MFISGTGPVTHLLRRVGRPVDVFITYDGKRASDIALSKYAVRHLVATEASSTCVRALLGSYILVDS